MMLKQRAYLIERKLSQTETAGFISLLQQQDADVFYVVPIADMPSAGAQPMPELEGEEKKKINQDLVSSLYRLGHTMAGKDTVAGQLAWNGFPTWYYHLFRINFKLQPILYRLAQYKKLLKAYQQLVVYTDQIPPSFLQQTVKEVVFVPGETGAKAQKKGSLFPLLSQMSKRFVAGAKQSLQRGKNFPRHLFVLNHAHVQPILDPDNLPEVYEDNVLAGYFLKDWSANFLLIDKQLIEKKETSIPKIKKRAGGYWERPLLFNEWIENKALANPMVLLKLRRYHRHLQKAYKKINKAIKDPFQKQLLHEVEQLHRSSLFFYFIYLAYRSFFKANSFKSVTLFDEYSPNFRAILDAARQEGVHTNAIQHGSLAVAHAGYSYAKEDERYNPWPDTMLVWGEHWKQMLIDHAAFPPERIRITGQIRTDIIPRLLETPIQLESVLNSKARGKFLILFATQPQPDESLRLRAALEVFRVAKEMPDAWVVLKLHPREKDSSYYTALARQAGCTNYEIHYETDLFLLLRLCNVLVHCYSTVGIEAVYFGMPAIILDYLNQDLLGFAAAEVALQAMDEESLRKHLLAVKQGISRLDEKKKQAYIKEYACAIDGKVSERTAQALLGADF